MYKYKVIKDVMGSAFMMDDILKDHGLMALIDRLDISLHFFEGGLYIHVPEKAYENHMEDVMEEFMTRDFNLAWKGHAE